MKTEVPPDARMRLHTLDEYVGQEHILGPGKLLRRANEANRLYQTKTVILVKMFMNHQALFTNREYELASWRITGRRRHGDTGKTHLFHKPGPKVTVTCSQNFEKPRENLL